MKFYELAVGARFEFHGGRFEKIAMSMAVLADGHHAGGDQGRWGNMFLGETEVFSDGPLLASEEAERWRPPSIHWADWLAAAPGGRQR
jgi:hypothetical protein